jgi:hypothetical protein
MLMRGPSDQAMLAALRGDAEPATVRAAYMQRLHENGRREFTDVNLAEVDLTDTQLVGADLSRADLSGADLSRAILDSVTFDGAVLADTRFVGSSLNFTSFVDARLSGTNLTAANLFAANLPGLDLADSAIVTTALTILPDSAAGPVLPGEDRSLATPGSPGAPGGSTGYVWIGNYTAEPSSWSLTLLANLALEPVVQDPRTMTTDGRYFVRASLSLREGLPQDDSIYFRGQTLTGVVPRGSEIELLGTPVAFQRGAAVHYWSEIRVICDSSAEDCTSPRFRISLIDTRDRELTQDLVARLVELGHAIDTTIAITRTPIDSVNLRCYHRADCSAAQPLLQVFLREFPDMRRGLNEQPARHPPGTLHFYY